MTEQNYPFINLDGKLIESENDERMRRKHGYNYGSLKEIYPDVHKLPETEIMPMIDKLYEADEPMESTVNRVKSYIAEKEPEWKTTYFAEKPVSENTGDYIQTFINAPLENTLAVKSKVNENATTTPQNSLVYLPQFDYSNSYLEPDLQTDIQPFEYIPVQPRKPKRNKEIKKGEDPFAPVKDVLLEYERNVEYPYYDKNGLNTNCVGNYNETYEEFASHPWRMDDVNGRLATPEEIRAEHEKLKKARAINQKYTTYKDVTSLRLPKEYCMSLLDKEISKRDKELTDKFPNYSKMDQHMKNALMEAHYTSNILPWKKLKKAAQKMDKPGVCENIHRGEDGRPDLVDRNKWGYGECIQGNFIK